MSIPGIKYSELINPVATHYIKTQEGNLVHLPFLRVEALTVHATPHGYYVTIHARVRPTPPVAPRDPRHAGGAPHWINIARDGTVEIRFNHQFETEHSPAGEANAIADAFHHMWAHEVAEHIRRSNGEPYIHPHPEGLDGPADIWNPGERA